MSMVRRRSAHVRAMRQDAPWRNGHAHIYINRHQGGDDQLGEKGGGAD